MLVLLIPAASSLLPHEEPSSSLLPHSSIDWRARALALEKELLQLRKESRRQTAKSSSSRGLHANVQVAHLDSAGAIPMPKNTTHVVLEIGCSDRNTLDDELLPSDDTAFLISFEPMVDKWAILLARGTPRYFGEGSRDAAVPLGHHHQRGVVLPMAITETGGPVNFNVGSVAGCSSVLAVNTSTTWGQWCAESLEQREVPSLSLSSAIALAGAKPIELVKIDAQGVDVSLVMATDPQLLRSRVRKVRLETVADDCNPLYEGQKQCAETVRYMHSIGYTLARGFHYSVGGGKGDELMTASVAAQCRSDAWYPRVKSRQLCEADLVFERA